MSETQELCPVCSTPGVIESGINETSWFSCSNPFCLIRVADGIVQERITFGRGSDLDVLTGRQRKCLCAAMFRELLGLGFKRERALELTLNMESTQNSLEDFLAAYRFLWEKTQLNTGAREPVAEGQTRIMAAYNEIVADEERVANEEFEDWVDTIYPDLPPADYDPIPTPGKENLEDT